LELASKSFDLGVWGVTDTGRMRTGNQDTFLALELTPSGAVERFGPDSVTTTEPNGSRRLSLGPRGALLVVADGMGGAAGGEIASRLAVESVAEAMEHTWAEGSTEDLDGFATGLRDAIVEAHARVQAYASDRPWLQGMGTTVTAVGVLDGSIAIAQVGDSRAYLLRGERLIQLTRDQTWVQDMVDSGVMTLDQARQSPRRNLLVQALGATSNLKVPVSRQDLRPGDVLVLCSDGLAGVLSGAEIADAVLSAPTLSEACESLVERANEAGGPDNITVLLAEPKAR
jgi:PPM family protein phosphatase